jgi:predicted transcriptional regulator
MAKKNKVSINDESEVSQRLVPKKVLGDLEGEIMQYMWDIERARVRHIFRLINHKRPIAYTTVMTVMGNLVEKGLLTRTSEGNRYVYQVAQSKDEFLRNISKKMVRSILHDFGDLAIAGFMGEISKIKPEKLDELKILLQEALDESPASE